MTLAYLVLTVFLVALTGHGAVALLMVLPYESHAYAGRESVVPTLWEMNARLEKYVTNAALRGPTSNDR